MRGGRGGVSDDPRRLTGVTSAFLIVNVESHPLRCFYSFWRASMTSAGGLVAEQEVESD